MFVDNNRSAWRRSRKRPGWDTSPVAIRAGRVGHVLVYHPGRLMRQPRDLEELLTLSEEHDITLHGQANRRDLSDPDDRFFLRIEVAHSCWSSDDTSQRLRDALEDRARAGRPHASAQRAYGYAPGGMVIVEQEAVVVVVREMRRGWQGVLPAASLVLPPRPEACVTVQRDPLCTSGTAPCLSSDGLVEARQPLRAGTPPALHRRRPVRPPSRRSRRRSVCPVRVCSLVRHDRSRGLRFVDRVDQGRAKP
ncbi:MAG: recombinase family protein [Pseudonocardiaceae bacterium]